MGYPDMGSGRYSIHLPYSDWVRLNNAQRAHYNMIEMSGPVLAALIIGGLYQPKFCSFLGFAYGFGRLLYSYGYRSQKGADGRMVGAMIATISTLLLFLLTIFYGAHSVNLFEQFRSKLNFGV